MRRHPIRDRDWFQDAYIRVAAVVVAAVMSQKTPPSTVSVIEEQLHRAYRRGLADGRKGVLRRG